MNGTLEDGVVKVGGNARQRYYDARGYGRPLDGNEVALDPVEAAHLLFRGDLDTVEGMDFEAFFADATGEGFAVRFQVYRDLRDRGFYLSPARDGWVEPTGDEDFVVFPRGSGPWDDEIAYRIRTVGERTRVPAAALGDCVLAVVDEEGEITYLDTDTLAITGSTTFDLPPCRGTLIDDRVVVWDPPSALYASAFYGQPLGGRKKEEGPVQLSLLEAAYLTDEGTLTVDGGTDAIVARGHEVEGERFDRRLRVYTELRDRQVVPKTGFKFGADFRTYADVESVSDLSHSEYLIRVLERDHAFALRELALDVRLAHGVRKRMVFALTDANDGTETWLSVGRLTP
ncbi:MULTISPECIES: tRNA-intron lyase [unclassified Haladaptatus]|uniref:tRNA-intron lyase n=1 Tax=unclassified Haladaptatus TaxID=2622732 RepID=UPI0023E87249|nr:MULTISPECIES: tRNA-intron lyase [unclassified Haladaptatus]